MKFNTSFKKCQACVAKLFFFFSSRRRHTRCLSDWSSDVCSSDLIVQAFGNLTNLHLDDPMVGPRSRWRLAMLQRLLSPEIVDFGLGKFGGHREEPPALRF